MTVSTTDRLERLLGQARDVLGKETYDEAPIVRENDIRRGELLGAGAFCQVHEISRILPSTGNANANDDESSSLSTNDDRKYAVKSLHVKKLTPSQLRRGQLDLALETTFLSHLQHPHIVQLKAVLPDSLVLERLTETLGERIQLEWSERYILAMSSGVIPGLPSAWSGDTMTDLEADLMVDRLLVAYDLTQAFAYLHKRGIVYRDTKPENIGFDHEGKVKLFDFGLAKPLHPHLRCEDNPSLYHLTARTGTFPYMAPEVALKLPYNEKADVFSFGILLWEILRLECAFANVHSRREFYFRVTVGGERPCIHRNFPPRVQQIMENVWKKEIRERMTMDEIAVLLRADLRDLSVSGESSTDKHMTEGSVRGVFELF